MGTIKDITDLLTELAKSIKDRELASKLFDIQALVAQFQSENIELQKEILDLKKDNQILTEKLNNKNQKTIFHANLLWLPDDEQPYCPTCYDCDRKLIHMHNFNAPYTRNRVVLTRPALKCPKCSHIAEISKHPKIGTS